MRVTEKGQVTIPKHIRDEFGIFPGVEVEFAVEDSQIVVRKVPGRGKRVVEHMRGRGRDSGKITTDEIMAMLRGD